MVSVKAIVNHDGVIDFIFCSICENGCVTCKQVACVEQCTLSEWSPFGECSAPCNGTQSRYQTLRGPNCQKNDTNVETRPCSTAATSYQKGCSTCTCSNNTDEVCVTNCAITTETCSQIEDPLSVYTFAPPTDGSCCGSCVKVPSTCLKIELLQSLQIYFFF